MKFIIPFLISLLLLFIQIKAEEQQDNINNDQNKNLNQSGSSEAEEEVEEEYVLNTIIDDAYLKPRDYDYKKENIWKSSCKKQRQTYLKNIKYGQKENYLYLTNQPKSYYDYKFSFIQEYGKSQNYKYGKKLGSGHYADVFLGVDERTDQQVVLKNLNQIKIDKIKREHNILKQLYGGPNIVNLIDIYPLKNKTNPLQDLNQRYVFNFTGKEDKYVENSDGELEEQVPVSIEDLKQSKVKRKFARATYVFDFITSTTVHKSEKHLLDMDIRCIMYDSLKALAYTHSKGIMHRDVKPGNLVYHMTKKQTKLIDFGLADYFLPNKPYHYRVATKTYKPPELLLNYTCYDYNMDTWSLGVTFGQLLFKKRPLFPGKEDIDILKQMIFKFGTRKMLQLIEKFDIKVDHFVASQFQISVPPRNWDSFKTKKNEKNFKEDAIDLLDKLLQFDFTRRISPLDALEHRYFDPVRDFKEGRNTTQVIFKDQIVEEESEEQSDSEDESDTIKEDEKVFGEDKEWYREFKKHNPHFNFEELEQKVKEQKEKKMREQQENQQQQEQKNNDNQNKAKDDL